LWPIKVIQSTFEGTEWMMMKTVILSKSDFRPLKIESLSLFISRQYPSALRLKKVGVITWSAHLLIPTSIVLSQFFPLLIASPFFFLIIPHFTSALSSIA
jgi:hypothetical protein